MGCVSKGQVHLSLINMDGVQPHAMYPIEAPPVDFATDKDTKGRYYYFIVIFFSWLPGMEIRADGTAMMRLSQMSVAS